MSQGYNDFTSRRFGYGNGSKKTLKGAMSVGGHGDGVGVNTQRGGVRNYAAWRNVAWTTFHFLSSRTLETNRRLLI